MSRGVAKIQRTYMHKAYGLARAHVRSVRVFLARGEPIDAIWSAQRAALWRDKARCHRDAAHRAERAP